MTCTAMFYHLIRAGRDDTVAMIVTRAHAQGWNVMIRAPDQAVLAQLDDRLWQGAEDGFLPHGVQGGAQDADQPVLLGQGGITNHARGLMLLAGATTTRDEVVGLDRLWLIFDGGNEAEVQAARAQWTEVTTWGLAAQYWSDETGSWVKKVDRPAPG